MNPSSNPLAPAAFSRRQNIVARLIQRELAGVIARSFRTKVMLTITVVRVSPDLSLAKAYVSIGGIKAEKLPDSVKEKVMRELQSLKKFFRARIAEKVKNKVRKVPEIAFFPDDSLDYAERIEELLRA